MAEIKVDVLLTLKPDVDNAIVGRFENISFGSRGVSCAVLLV